MQEKIQQAVDKIVESGAETGIQVSVYHQGEEVASVAAGLADKSTRRKVRADTPFPVMSTGKGILSALIHVLADKGALDYSTPLVDLWPDFGAAGKDKATVAHALTHTLGVPALPADLTPEGLCDTERVCAEIAGQQAWWKPGTKSGYHPLTFGFILERIAEGATKQSVGELLVEHVTGPLGIHKEVYLGVPKEELKRVAKLEDPDWAGEEGGEGGEEFDMSEFPMFQVRDGFTPAPMGVLPSAELANDPHNLQNSAASATMSAHGIATVYAALLGEVRGVSLVGPETRALFTAVAASGDDEIIAMPVTRSLGFDIGRPTPGSEAPTVFGMGGANGSGGYADAAKNLAVAVTKTSVTMGDFSTYEAMFDIASAAVD